MEKIKSLFLVFRKKSATAIFSIVAFIFISSCTSHPENFSNEDQKTIEHFSEAMENDLPRRHPDSALNLAFDIIAISDRIKEKDIVLQAINVAAISFNISRMPDSALYYSGMMEQLASEIGDVRNLTRSYNISAMANLKKQDFEEAEIFVKKAIQTNKNYGETKDIASYYQNLGRIFNETGNFDSAIYYYQVAARKFEINDQPKHLAQTYGNIGSIHVHLKNFIEAQNYYSKAIVINKQIDNPGSLVHNYNNIGVLFKELAKYDTAKLYFDSAITINESTGNRYMMMATKFNYASVLKKEVLNKKTLKFYLDILTQAEEMNMDIAIFKSKSAIGDTYLKTGDFQKANQFLEEALRLTDKKGLSGDREGILLGLTQAAIGMNDREKATQTLSQYQEAIDSLNFHNQQKIVSDLEARYQLREKDTKLKYMDRVNHSKTNLNYALAFVILLLVFLVVFVFLLYRSKNKNLVLHNERIEKDKALTQLELEKAAMQAKLKEEEAEKTALSIKLKEELSGMIVHDLKNPLNNIINSTDDNPAIQNLKLRQSGKKMLNMVNNILDVYKYEFTKIPIDPSENKLIELTEKAISEINYSATEKDLSIQNFIPAKVLVNADAELLIRVMTNLLTNAIKYSPTNGSVELKISPERSDSGFLYVTVCDRGTGIPIEMQQKVFEQFSQVDENNTQTQGSSGIGLSFCKMAIEAHGGKIGIDEKYTEGTRVFFTIPLASTVETEIQEATPLETPSELAANEKAILSPYLLRLVKLKIYEVSRLRSIVREMEQTPNINNVWLADFKNAINFGNEQQFQFLISQIKS